MRMAWGFFRLLLPTVFAVGLCLHGAAAIHARAKARPSTRATPPAEETASTIGIDTEARNAIIVEVETGAVLLDKGADEHIPPASMSKMMTRLPRLRHAQERPRQA